MTPAIILGLCILAPAILAFILRVNAAILFMSLCVGEVLVIFVSNNATSYLSPLSPSGHISFSSMRLDVYKRQVETRVEISFEQAVFGTEVELNLNIEDNCEHCKGTTVEPGYSLKTCDNCHGQGQVTNVMRTCLLYTSRCV